MVTRPKFFDDLAGMAGGAFSALSGLGEEVEQLVRTRIDETLVRLKVVRREEFDAVAELAANARAAQEELASRVAALEAREGLGAAPATHNGSPDPHLETEGGVGGPPASDESESEAHPS
jgi:BMFP domain-containing protein YqiC